MKSTRFIHRTCECALSIPDRSPLLSTETIVMAGIVSRDLERFRGARRRRSRSLSAWHVSLGREKREEEGRKRRNRLCGWQPPWNLRHLPSTPRLKLLRSARDDRCLVSSFTPLGSGNRSCLANVSSLETIFLFFSSSGSDGTKHGTSKVWKNS